MHAAVRLALAVLGVDVRLVLEIAHLVNAHRCRPPLPTRDVERVVEWVAGQQLTHDAGTKDHR